MAEELNKGIMDVLDNFVTQMRAVYPDDKGIAEVGNSLDDIKRGGMMGNFKKEALLTYLYTTLPQYEKKIRAKDESFILHDYSKFYFINKIDVPKYWKEFDEGQRQGVWDTLDALLMYVTIKNTLGTGGLRGVKNVMAMVVEHLPAEAKNADGSFDFSKMDLPALLQKLDIKDESKQESLMKGINELLPMLGITPTTSETENPEKRLEEISGVLRDPAATLSRIKTMDPQSMATMTEKCQSIFGQLDLGELFGAQAAAEGAAPPQPAPARLRTSKRNSKRHR
jgi:hypothetical protein